MTGAWANMVNTEDLMTEAEHKAMDMTADLFNHISQNIIGKDPDARGDLHELVGFIHDIQRMIMSQAACRAFPNKYRLLGERIPPRKPVYSDRLECGYVNDEGLKCYNASGHDPLYPHIFRRNDAPI